MKKSKDGFQNKNLSDSYEEFKEKSKIEISEREYKNINYLYFKFLVAHVMMGDTVTLPSRMGTLTITGRKPKIKTVTGDDGKKTFKGLPPDWVATKKLWKKNPEARKERKIIYHLNGHSDGIVYRWFWSRRGILAKNKVLYSLRMSRTNKRLISTLVQKGRSFTLKY